MIVEAVRRFTATRGSGVAYTSVPVSGPWGPWVSDTPAHFVDAVWLEGVGNGETVDRRPAQWSARDREEFAAAVEAADRVAVISGRGYADRTVFGQLIAAREMFSRSFPGHGVLRAVALADRLDARSAPYFVEQIEIVSPDGIRLPDPSRRRSRRRGAPASPSREDRMLERFYESTCGGSGSLWQEVVIGSARLDGLFARDGEARFEFWKSNDEFLAQIVEEFDVTVVEAKAELNGDVIGQVVAGALMLSHAVPQHRLIRQSVVVGPHRDAALEWVCAKRGIEVVRVSAD